MVDVYLSVVLALLLQSCHLLLFLLFQCWLLSRSWRRPGGQEDPGDAVRLVKEAGAGADLGLSLQVMDSMLETELRYLIPHIARCR